MRGHRVRLSFRGKHSIQVRSEIVDEELAGAMRELLKLPGGVRVFRYEWEGTLRSVNAAMRRVAQQLGNTPAVCRASYVSPAVIDPYLEGRTIADFRPRHLRVVGARELGLDAEEQALIGLLRSWRIRQARAAA